MSLADKMTIDEAVLSDNNTSDLESDGDTLEFSTIEETFGSGANQRVLLVTKGTSIKNLVESSK